MNFFTIGVYGSTEDQFFAKLVQNRIDTFIDIRQRRGVRGAQYAFVNSQQLQEKLKQLHINYVHVLELAPTKEIRKLQEEADKHANISKRSRTELGVVFKHAYQKHILDFFDMPAFLNDLKSSHQVQNAILFCVEQTPAACHRSLVSKRISNSFGEPVIHL